MVPGGETALLDVAGLRKRYGSLVVVDDVGFSVAPGTCLGVIGPNGAGKSSLFDLIAGTVAPDGGRILFGGRDISRLPAHLRARLGLVRAFQVPQAFNKLSTYQNVLAPARFGAQLGAREAADWALEVLNRLQLGERAETPAGQLTLLDRKRLELAKAIAARAKLLLLDEIAAGLTEREVENLIATIAGLKADHALIWIEHIPHALAAVADRVMVLHFGRNVLMGAPGEVTRSALVREIYMGLPVEKESGVVDSPTTAKALTRSISR